MWNKSQIPDDKGLDSTLDLLKEGYLLVIGLISINQIYLKLTCLDKKQFVLVQKRVQNFFMTQNYFIEKM